MIGLGFFPLKSADVRRAGTRDEPLRTSGSEATVLPQGFLLSLFPKEGIGKREEHGEEVSLSLRALMCTACEIKPGGGGWGGGGEAPSGMRA